MRLRDPLRTPFAAATRLVPVLAILLLAAGPAHAQRVEVRYREAADVFEILDHVSDWWPGYLEPEYRRAWADSVGFRRGDEEMFARYKAVRERYFDRSGQGGDTPWREGSGLFTDRAVLAADPVGAAFYASETVDEALRRLAPVVAPGDVVFLRRFYAHFRGRWQPLVARTRALTAASRAATAGTLASAGVDEYLSQVGALFGSTAPEPFTALYVWWPESARNAASPSGRFLVLRVRPRPGETVNSADVVAHEAIHVLLALQPDEQKQRWSGAVLDRCQPSAAMRRLTLLEEPIATALGNIEFRRRFQPQRFSWGRQWYGDPWADMLARLLHPALTTALPIGRAGDGLAREMGELCGQLASWKAGRAP